MNLSLENNLIAMAKNDAITPEILYYFDTERIPDRILGTIEDAQARSAKPSLSVRIRYAIFSGLAKFCLVAVTLSAPLAAPVEEAVRQAETPQATVSVRGAAAPAFHPAGRIWRRESPPKTYVFCGFYGPF